ncbi:hypothetical protein CC1G_06036 [Coprinopsis cinerea okayama7|uniref:Uncharacterized protein n=1 Tax=Coprinopsis cinerea (strain Okayama-7 / 130 / ATCC MYA-4618 / FGSC 9003) TaxID=240176 RepID=A8N4F9_COPC7|nr:hypothetical protein CC1G_06036 [Coprinopsis cinerea okayama7\|eukprot:XP_001829827.2 hypothetical protein CC1G_06036 [Coprinopsis cinerea okayama7\
MRFSNSVALLVFAFLSTSLASPVPGEALVNRGALDDLERLPARRELVDRGITPPPWRDHVEPTPAGITPPPWRDNLPEPTPVPPVRREDSRPPPAWRPIDSETDSELESRPPPAWRPVEAESRPPPAWRPVKREADARPPPAWRPIDISDDDPEGPPAPSWRRRETVADAAGVIAPDW